MGIPVVLDLPGVGANLQNHPVLFIGLHQERGARQVIAGNTNIPTIMVAEKIAATM